MPIAAEVVAHSPTPSIVRTTASSNGDGKKALAAWLRWCSLNSSSPFQLVAPVELLQLLLQQVLEEQLLPQPERDRHAERLEPARRERHDRSRPAARTSGTACRRTRRGRSPPRPVPTLAQAIVDRVRRKPGVMLLAREALFLRRGNDAPVFDQRRGAIVIEGRDPEDLHRRSAKSVSS